MDNEKRTTINVTKGTAYELNKYKVNNRLGTIENTLKHLLRMAKEEMK